MLGILILQRAKASCVYALIPQTKISNVFECKTRTHALHDQST